MRKRNSDDLPIEATTRPFEVRGLNPWENRKAVYEVVLRSGRSVYMRMDSTNYSNTDRMVVLVDSQRFLLHWRADRAGLHAHEANGDPTTWIHDYKFGLATKGFALGVENPVPLATVGCRFNTNEHFLAALLSRIDPRRQPASPVVTFTNGITRTLWLLTNGASSFPVECSRDDSQLLANCCGLPGATPQSVFEITHGGDKSN
jgi:hypothetical protein